MAKKIILKNNINNTSIQIGDTAYFVDSVSATTGGFQASNEVPKIVGSITEIGGNFIKVETVITEPPADSFIMFQKDRKVNNTSLLGYYAEVKLSNNSTEKAELFALNSGIAASSK